MHWIQDGFAVIEPYVHSYGSLAIFVVIYLEALGVPAPGESALIAVSALAAQGDIDLVQALVAAFLGAVLGDNTGYAIGRFGGRPLILRYAHLIKLTPDRFARLEALFRSKGFWIVMGARFVVILRQLNGLLAGSAAMPWPRFQLANALGAAAWVLVWGVGPYALLDSARILLER